MHTGQQNGVESEETKAKTQEPIVNGNAPDYTLSSSLTGPKHLERSPDNQEDNGLFEQPPAKRQCIHHAKAVKIARPPSPPWKSIKAEGPSAFVEDGVRKSARTNHVPAKLLPLTEKRRSRRGSISDQPKPGRDARSRRSDSALLPKSGKEQGDEVKSSKPVVPIKQDRGASNSTCKAPVGAVSAGRHVSSSHQGSNTLSHEDSKSTKDPPRRPVGRPRIVRSPASEALRSKEIAKPRLSAPLIRPSTNGYHHPAEDPVPRKRPRIIFRQKLPEIEVSHIDHIVRRSQVLVDGALRRAKFVSFPDWLEREGRYGLEGDAVPELTPEEIVGEAQLRRRIALATTPKGSLDICKLAVNTPEASPTPARLYTHHDRLVAHAKRFQQLMCQERSKHMKNAKECAFQAAAAVHRRNQRENEATMHSRPKTDDEIRQEREQLHKALFQQLQRDIRQKWIMVRSIVEQRRIDQWQREQERLGKEALNKAIETSRGLLSKHRHTAKANASDEDSDILQVASDSESSAVESSDISQNGSMDENMTSSDSGESDSDQEKMDEDASLSAHELRLKYSRLKERSDASGQDKEIKNPSQEVGARAESQDRGTFEITAVPTRSPSLAAIQLDEIDPEMLDDSQEESMSETDSVESADSLDSSDSEASDRTSSMSDDDFGALGGFLSKAERSKIANSSINDTASVSRERSAVSSAKDFRTISDEEADVVSLIPDLDEDHPPSNGPNGSTEYRAIGTKLQNDLEMSNADSAISNEPDDAHVAAQDQMKLDKSEKRNEQEQSVERSASHDFISDLPAMPVSNQSPQIPIPALLRGTLREYQHQGLEWLAGLYANGTNGILADEMGLGKTIQTISLLAHLAVQHEVWGPHLIVVPTSVMLNWEMEFKKFLPGFKVLAYYGSQEERKKKRAGWMDDEKWNVWITSYTLITQDQQIFKRRAWHYMILDEAHNIKNFQSQRWQILLTFRTHARLLLTGTPLQNNLTELWSLLYFLMPSQETTEGILGFTNLEDFTGWFKRPTDQILQQGREQLDEDARAAVAKLHDILRPYLLRRLKADVEKQMPGKFEHVVYCKLSKRQRYLYDGFMSRAQTKETMASGNTFSIMNALMQLRKVCNHPDLFETRQIVTSFAMPRAVASDFEIKELLIRRRLFNTIDEQIDMDLLNLGPCEIETTLASDTTRRQRLAATTIFQDLLTRQNMSKSWSDGFDGSTIYTALDRVRRNMLRVRNTRLRSVSHMTSLRSQRHPLYSQNLLNSLHCTRYYHRSAQIPPACRLAPLKSTSHSHLKNPFRLANRYHDEPTLLHAMITDLDQRAEMMRPYLQKFACVTPAVVCADMVLLTLGRRNETSMRTTSSIVNGDAFHESRMQLSIAFPDKRLLQYDCGKLQKLDLLLRRLQAGGHRALIFTQMTRVLDILEQFLNIHGHRYLRLDGATKIEQRQVLTDRFNNDTRILAFILSSRSGGIGINLTGADTVIFYDMDWNPAMDKQCQDRAHRIGQVRDVHIYRFVSEHTIEANILRKANQKRLLDTVVIQQGGFTTDYSHEEGYTSQAVRESKDDALNEAEAVTNAAMDRVLGNRTNERALEAVEDKEDVIATKEAQKEIIEDAQDFNERATATVSASASASAVVSGNATAAPATPIDIDASADNANAAYTHQAEAGHVSNHIQGATSYTFEHADERPSCDDYMIAMLEWELRDMPFQPPADKSRPSGKKKKKGKEATVRKR